MNVLKNEFPQAGWWLYFAIAAILSLYMYLIFFSLSDIYFYRVFVIKWKYLTMFTPIFCLFSIAIWYLNKKNSINILDLSLLFFVIFITYNYIQNDIPARTKFQLFLLLTGTYFWGKVIFSYYHEYLIYFLIFNIIIIGIGQSIIGIGQIIDIIPSNNVYFKLTGSFINPAPYAIFITLSIILSLSILIQNNSIPKPYKSIFHLAAIVNVCLGAFIVFVSGCRTAWISFIFSGSILFLNSVKWKEIWFDFYKKSPYKAIFSSCFAIFCLCLCLYGIYLVKQDSADSRSLIWKITGQIIWENPISGTGYGGFEGLYGSIQSKYLSSGRASINEINISDVVQYAFNDYLQIAAQNGIPVLIAFLIILFITCKQQFKSRSPLLYPLISIIVSALTSYPLNNLPILVILLLIISSTEIQKHNTKRFHRIIQKYSLLIVIVGYTIYSLHLLPFALKRYQAYISWKNAQMLYSIPDYQALAKCYNNLYQYLNDQSTFLFEYGKILSQTSEFNKSNQILKEGIILSGDPMFYNIIGNNYKKMNLPEQAEKSYYQAYYTLPNRIYPLYLLSILYYDTQQYDQFNIYAHKVLNFIPKIESPAVNQMKNEIYTLLENN